MTEYPSSPTFRKRRRATLEELLRKRNKTNATRGNAPGWADEALDLFLAGEQVCSIAHAYSLSSAAVSGAIARAALYRLMKAHAAERLDQMKDLTQEPRT
jgi:hypothetical protein